MPSRETGAALRSVGEELDSIAELILLLQQRRAEKKQQEKEEERAGRTEKRAERRLGIAERGEARDIAGVEKEVEKEAGIARKTSDLLASPTTQSVVGRHRETKGVGAGNLATQTLGTARTPQEASGMINALELDTYNAMQLLGEQKKKEGEEADLNALIEGLPEPARSRIKAQIAGLDVKSSITAYPGEEAEADDKPSDEWYRNKIIGLLTKINPDTQVTYTEEDIIRMMRLSPEQVQTYFGRTKGGVGQGEKGTLSTATGLPDTAPVEAQTKPAALSAEAQPAPMEEEYNPADHIPAGDEMPVAGEGGLSPEEQTEHDLIKKAVAQGTKLTTEDFRAKLIERGFAPDSIERILSGL